MLVNTLESARELIDAHLDDSIDLSAMARAAGISRFHFLRKARKTCEELKSKGIEFMKPPTDEFYGVEALFKDGCGNWFSLTQHK